MCRIGFIDSLDATTQFSNDIQILTRLMGDICPEFKLFEFNRFKRQVDRYSCPVFALDACAEENANVIYSWMNEQEEESVYIDCDAETYPYFLLDSIQSISSLSGNVSKVVTGLMNQGILKNMIMVDIPKKREDVLGQDDVLIAQEIYKDIFLKPLDKNISFNAYILKKMYDHLKYIMSFCESLQ
jgi:hypothetical protein